MDDPRRRISELTRIIKKELADSLIALYLYGSVPVGGFVERKSDIDLLAVTATDITEAQLPSLAKFHGAFVEAHPEWDNRIEVGYVSQAVLQTLSDEPSGSFAVVSPGEPVHIRSPDASWVLNWHSVTTTGETLFGPSPLEIGSPISPEVFRRVLRGQLAYWGDEVRSRWIGHSRAYQGYIVLTVCRALYGLETGRATTKERAGEWAADRFPEWADFMQDAVRWHRADLSEPHSTTIKFVDFATHFANLS